MDSGLFGEMLVKEGLLKRDALEIGLVERDKTGARIGDILVGMGALAERDRLQMLGAQTGLPFITTDGYPETPPPISRPLTKFLKNYKVVPLRVEAGVLEVATANFHDPYPLEALGLFTGLEVRPVIGSEKDILRSIESYYGGGVSMEKIIEGMDGKEAEGASFDTDDVEQLKDMASEAPVINLVNILVTRAVERRASDIHIEPFEGALKVRYRIDGILYLIESLPRRLHPAISSRIKIMSKLNIAERRLPQDGRIKIKAGAKEIDIRVSTIPTLYGESVVMRLLDSAVVRSLDSIGFSKKAQGIFGSLMRQPHGMILVTGPTGSGKSTTLYAALSKIDTGQKKVITIEDPVEYNIDGINQIQVKPKIGFTFANGLRSIVRQDPDVIMVGEIRDPETADIAVHSALTGHLILSTLHTNDAPGAVTRLMDMGIEGYLISSSLLGVLAQRLVRVICDDCKTEDDGAAEIFKSFRTELERIGIEAGDFRAFRGKGCELCGNTGYRGRTAISELLLVTDEIRELVAEKKGSDAIRHKAIEQGMMPLREDGWAKVLSGVTTAEEVSRVTLEQ